MKIFRCFLTILTLTFSVSCAISPMRFYSASNSAEAASIVGSDSRISNSYWERFSLLAVDNHYLKTNVSGNFLVDQILINPGNHILIIRADYNHGNDHRGQETAIAIRADLLPNGKYRIVGKIYAGRVSIWLEDIRQGNRVTEIKIAPFG